MVTDNYDAEREKRQQKIFKRLDDPPEFSLKKSSWKIQKKLRL